MDEFNYKHLVIFQKIVEEKSVRKAAAKMGITASSVSKCLKSLESQFDILLFVRDKNSLVVTQDGKELYNNSKLIVESVSDFLDNVREKKEEPQGTVRIMTTRFAYKMFLKNIIGSLYREFPLIEIVLSFNEFNADQADENFDIAIDVGDSIKSKFVVKRLSPDFKQALYASPSYIDNSPELCNASDINMHQLIFHAGTHEQQRGVENLFGMSKLPDDSVSSSQIVVNDYEAVKDLVLEKMGVGLLPQKFVQKELEANELIPVLPNYWQKSEGIFLYFHQKMQKTRRIRVVIDFLVSHASLEF
jgi:DNA-binding transcriptional LysR family regulator